MAYDGYVLFNDVEVVNLSRTAQLAAVMGIDVVWTSPSSVAWVQDIVAEDDENYGDVTQAPWYDSGFQPSTEFAGIIPLSISGLDDSTYQSTPIEYITDGGNPGKGRSSTLTLVWNVRIIASTDRGAEFGKRWLDRMLQGGGSGSSQFCVGSDLKYLAYQGTDAPLVHRRDVKLTRGMTITGKRVNDCSSTWTATFTQTAADPFEYGEEIPVITDLGSEYPSTTGDVDAVNLATSPIATSTTFTGQGAGYNGNYFAGDVTLSVVASGGDGPVLNGLAQAYARRTMKTAGLSFRRLVWVYTAQNPDVATASANAANTCPVIAGRTYRVTRWWRLSASIPGAVLGTVARFYDSSGALISSPGNTVYGPAPIAGTWQRITATYAVPADAVGMAIRATSTGSYSSAAGDTSDTTGLIITDVTDDPSQDLDYFDGSTPTDSQYVYDWQGTPNASPSERRSRAGIASFGELVLTQEDCAVYDYSPIYDPLYPALIPSPTAPDMLPAGWGIVQGETFERSWAILDPIEPSALAYVPIIKLRTDVDARSIRVSIFPSGTDTDAQCGALFSAVVTYLPADSDFYIDGEQQACYLWNGLGDAVRRTDSLVYSPDAEPLDWTAFADPGGLLVVLDIFAVDSGEFEGGGDVRATLTLVPKSD